MAKKDHEDFNNYTKFWVCKKAYDEGEVKVKDHDHVTEKYHRYTHQECNLSLSQSKENPYFVS